MTGSDWQQSERRGHPRKPFSTRVHYTTLGGVSKGFIRNVAAGGVCIESTVPLYVGQRVALSFWLPNRKTAIWTTGRVAWGSLQGFGVKFDQENEYLELMTEAP